MRVPPASEIHLESINGIPVVKTLGVTWLPDEYVFVFKGNPPDELFELIKGNFVQNIANSSHKSVLLEEKWATGLE